MPLYPVLDSIPSGLVPQLGHGYRRYEEDTVKASLKYKTIDLILGSLHTS